MQTVAAAAVTAVAVGAAVAVHHEGCGWPRVNELPSSRLGHSCARELRVVGFWDKLTPAQPQREMASWAEREAVWLYWAELRVSVGPI